MRDIVPTCRSRVGSSSEIYIYRSSRHVANVVPWGVVTDHILSSRQRFCRLLVYVHILISDQL